MSVSHSNDSECSSEWCQEKTNDLFALVVGYLQESYLGGIGKIRYLDLQFKEAFIRSQSELENIADNMELNGNGERKPDCFKRAAVYSHTFHRCRPFSVEFCDDGEGVVSPLNASERDWFLIHLNELICLMVGFGMTESEGIPLSDKEKEDGISLRFRHLFESNDFRQLVAAFRLSEFSILSLWQVFKRSAKPITDDFREFLESTRVSDAAQPDFWEMNAINLNGKLQDLWEINISIRSENQELKMKVMHLEAKVRSR